MQAKSKVFAALAVAGAVAAGGGSAFTAGNTMPATTMAGYGSSTISGATATSVSYTLDSTGANITAENIVFSGDVHANTVKAGFNGTPLTACAAGTYTTGTPGSTAVTCSVSSPTSSSTSFDVAVS